MMDADIIPLLAGDNDLVINSQGEDEEDDQSGFNDDEYDDNLSSLGEEDEAFPDGEDDD